MVVKTKDEIAVAVARLGQSISRDYRGGTRPLMLGVLSGAFIFMADLVRQVSIDVDIGFIRATSYVGTHSSGSVRVDDTLTPPVSGVPVILVDDILDSGLTSTVLHDHLSSAGAHSISLVCLLRKPNAVTLGRRWRSVYIGHDIPSTFVYGYGMDLHGKERHRGAIYAVVDDGSGV